MGGILNKIMGPLMTAGGLIAAPFTGGSTLGLAMGGLQNMMGPGGLLGQKPPSATPTVAAPALTQAPMGPPATPEIPGPAGSGLALSVPGAGAQGGTGAGTAGDLANLVAQSITTGGGGSPFAAFGA